MGFWEEVQGEQPPRTCGSCNWCERWDEDMGVRYDPWAYVGEPLRSELREKLGICGLEGDPPEAVYLDGKTMPCNGEWYERRHA